MKFASTIILPLALATSVAARSLWPLGSSQAAIHTTAELEVPGENPLTYCQEPKDYLFDIEKVDLSPNPPKAGQQLNITATGTLSKDIEKGAKALISVKYGLIKILTLNVDLCDQAEQVDLECPVKKGPVTIKKTVSLPNEVPSGKYTVDANVISKDNDEITCLKAIVIFSKTPKQAEFEIEDLGDDL